MLFTKKLHTFKIKKIYTFKIGNLLYFINQSNVTNSEEFSCPFVKNIKNFNKVSTQVQGLSRRFAIGKNRVRVPCEAKTFYQILDERSRKI